MADGVLMVPVYNFFLSYINDSYIVVMNDSINI